MSDMPENAGRAQPRAPLEGLRVLDLTRILAGPTCTQLLGDLGADIVKIERPPRDGDRGGDDTRKWGPPYVTDAEGRETSESAYYLCANRNKRSVAIDIAAPEGAALVRQLAERSDVLIENFKVGGLEKYGLAWDQLRSANPRLVYCSITGFGQTGPYAHRPGYDILAQAMGGIMSITGEPDGPPTKVGVGISDVMAGMYAAVAILAALRHRDATGEGQRIDVSLLDTQVAWLINEGLNYLTSGEVPRRRGTAHPNIVPYQMFEAADGPVIIAVGNDAQFARFCTLMGLEALSENPRFATNAARIRNREALIPIIAEAVARKTRRWILDGLERLKVPASPVNDIGEVFADPQVQARGMRITMDHPLAGSGTVDLIGNPLKLSGTPVAYRRPPPLLGQHTDEVLGEVLGLDESALEALARSGVIARGRAGAGEENEDDEARRQTG